MAYCKFVIVSEFNDYWLTKFPYWFESGAVSTHIVRCSRTDDQCTRCRVCIECGCIVG